MDRHLKGMTAALLVPMVISCLPSMPPASNETTESLLDYLNGPECAETVAYHRANPDAPVDLPPIVRTLLMPPASDRRPEEELEVTVVVTETGLVQDNSVVVKGSDPAPNVRAAIAAAYRWTFRPAMAAGCWVPARYSFLVTI